MSARTPGDALFGRDLAGLGPAEGLELRWTYTRAAPPGWTGWERRVDAAMLEALGPPPAARPLAFVCGSTPFVEHVAGLLVDAGHDPGRIHTERFGPSAA